MNRKNRIKGVVSVVMAGLLFFACWQCREANRAEAKAQELIDADKEEYVIYMPYYYDGKFTLATEDNKFYFIDKAGKKNEKLGEWEKIEQFDGYPGFAKVTNRGKTYLLDTLGNKYKYADNINNIDNTVEALNLSYQKLLNFPAKIWELKNLKILKISSNDLESLPPEIGKLTKLTWLDLYHNKLTDLPAEIWELTNLTTLCLTGNKLTSLPSGIGRLTNLTELYLDYNELTSLPAEIGELTNLTTLSLPFTNLPPEIWKLTNLFILQNFAA